MIDPDLELECLLLASVPLEDFERALDLYIKTHPAEELSTEEFVQQLFGSRN
jgi:hypothetical protein